jgi:predicted nucleic acid-binding protein
MTGEAAYQFLDTNILVYAHDRSAGKKHELAKALVQKLWDTGNGCLSIQVLQEFYVTVTRKVPQPVPFDTAARIISDLGFWRIHAPEAKDVLGAIDLQQRYQLSFWDAMVVWSAAELGCRVIWSEDLNPGQVYDGVRLQNPFEG